MSKTRARPSRASVVGLGLTLSLLAASMAPAPALANPVEVGLKLPMRARVDLTNRSTLVPAPFVVLSQEGEGRIRGTNIDVRAEFERYLNKVLRRESTLKILDTPNVSYPTFDMEMLAQDTEFWLDLGDRTQADLIVTGSLDFDIQDRSGYRNEEYVSPLNGRTYYRQVLVEQTGFEYDIVIQVYDGTTGELLLSDNFKDFKTFEGDQADPLRGMFQNLYALEDRIVGLFAQREVQASRLLYID